MSVEKQTSKKGGNMLINRNKLRGQIVEKQINQSDLAKKLNMSRETYYKKLRGEVEYKESEIVVLKSIFGNYIFLA